MGSPLRLQVAVPGARSAAIRSAAMTAVVDAAWTAVVDEFEAIEQALSRFRETSEIHRARLAGGNAAQPSRRFMAALVTADRARRVTEGRFDPRLVLDLERLGSMPIAVRVEAGPDAPIVRPDPTSPVVRRVGRRGPVEVPVPVDFGGIGKGLALRWAARRAAERLGSRPFLLEAGGDIVARGRPGPDSWRIGIEDPRGSADPVGAADGSDPASPVVVIELPPEGGAVATSSVRLATWTAPDGRTVHHLLDPQTGEPAGGGLLAVTVSSTDPAWAEVWSKSLFVEGHHGIAGLARRHGLAAWWATATGELEMTPAARLRTVWTAAEAARA
jgi:thiamine biosynthesis lipoprotein